MRILITAWPSSGHLLPMLPLARAAQRAGHQVLIASGADVVEDIERRGLGCWQVGPSRAESEAAYRARQPDTSGLTFWQRITADVAGMFAPAALERAEDLVPRALAWEPDLVVQGIAELAGVVAAAHSGARHVVYGLGLAPPGVCALFAPGLTALGARWDLPELASALLDATYLDPCPPRLQPGGPADFRQVLPVRPSAGEALPGERLRWSGAALAALPHPDTIHLSVGTIVPGKTEVIEAALTALRQVPVNVVVTLGPGTHPRELGPQPPHVLITDHVPQAVLLPHCRVVISHGGASIITGALCHGLPQLILPYGADHALGAVACERAGAALALPPGNVTAGSIAAALRRLLIEPELRMAAQAIQAEIAMMPDADAVLATLCADHPAPEGTEP